MRFSIYVPLELSHMLWNYCYSSVGQDASLMFTGLNSSVPLTAQCLSEH